MIQFKKKHYVFSMCYYHSVCFLMHLELGLYMVKVFLSLGFWGGTRWHSIYGQGTGMEWANGL